MKKSPNLKDMKHTTFLSRIQKSLYYAKLPVINCLSFHLVEFAAEAFTKVKSDHTLKRLDIGEASKISRNACVSPCSLVLALLYIEKLKKCNPEYLRQVTLPELFLVSLLVASKYLHDDGEEDEVLNKEWARSAEIPVRHMNKLERDFLAAIDWTVVVQHEDFWEKLQQIEKLLAYREIQKRGWCTYTEMRRLMNPVQLIAIARNFIKVSSICLATYVTSLASLLGSTLLAHLIVQSCLPRTCLDTRQPLNLQANLTSTDLNSPLIDAQSGMINNDVLSIFNPSSSHEITHSCTTTETNVTSSQWLNSTMTRLQNDYNAVENNHAEITNCTYNNPFANNANYSFNSTRSMASKTEEKGIPHFTRKKYHRSRNWEIPEMIFTLLMEDFKSQKIFYENSYRTELNVYY